MSDVKTILTTSGAAIPGHTEFKNGYHGNGWVEKGFIIRNPELLDQVAAIQAQQIQQSFGVVDVLVGPVNSASILASYVARHLQVEFAAILGKGDTLEFHRFYKPDPGKKVVIIEDLAFTGTDIDANIKFTQHYGLQLLGVSLWISRRPTNTFATKTITLSNPIFEYYKQSACPLCAKNEPILHHNVRE